MVDWKTVIYLEGFAANSLMIIKKKEMLVKQALHLQTVLFSFISYVVLTIVCCTSDASCKHNIIPMPCYFILITYINLFYLVHLQLQIYNRSYQAE